MPPASVLVPEERVAVAGDFDLVVVGADRPAWPPP